MNLPHTLYFWEVLIIKHFFLFSVVALLIFSLAAGCGNIDSPPESDIYERDGTYFSKYARITCEEWNLLCDGEPNPYFNVPEEFLEDVDYYIDSIAEYLGIKFSPGYFDDEQKRINIASATDLTRYIPWEWTIYFTIDHFKEDPPIAHELTHFIAPTSSKSHSEGLAQLMQLKFGKTHWERDLEVYESWKYMDDSELIEMIGTYQLRYPPGGEEILNTYYILCHSFTKYLVDEYGIENYMEVYTATSEAKYEEVYGKDLEQLRSEWIDSTMAQAE